ncbi:YmaF family protein [Neobacillus niacini]|uniref:YmaF family protein n=1 Tax=Neobacillus niacini TaxID=86668 RepID=UPI0005EDD535|nr:YmaF family protein [Neobacillus niacini]
MSKAQRQRENYERNRSQKGEQSNKNTNSEESEQTHVHEFLASTKLAEEGEDRHNHRFAGVTSEVIPKGDSHVHVILTNTDFLDHHHEVGIQTGPAIPVGNGKHVHFVKGTTTLDDGHVHELEFATLIEKPLV